MKTDYQQDTTVRECLIKGKRVHYDACSTSRIEDAKSFYDNMKYIGSGKTYWLNGHENKSKITHHFFVKA